MTDFLTRLVARLGESTNQFVRGFEQLMLDSRAVPEDAEGAAQWAHEMMVHYAFGFYDAMDDGRPDLKAEVRRLARGCREIEQAIEWAENGAEVLTLG